MKYSKSSRILSAVLLSIFFVSCDDLGVQPRLLPSVVSFSASTRSIREGQTIVFRLHAAAELGLVGGVIDFRDGTNPATIDLSGSRDSASISHTYLVAGIFKPTLTIEDVSGRRAASSDSVAVRIDQLPQVNVHLSGLEGSVGRFPKKFLATDPEGDSLRISIAPISPGLIFSLNASGDSVIYFLANQDDNGSKQGKVTVVDQRNRTVEQIIDIYFSPRDDISGRVHDRFEGTYLAGYKPASVMQGPFKGWVAAITGSDTVKVPVDAGGHFALPKLTSLNHTFRAFITNGRDSSFIAASQVSTGDRSLDLSVETNAGTGMPLHRLLTLYQAANFRKSNPSPGNDWGSCLVGMDLKSPAYLYNYQIYLVSRNILSSWMSSKSLTAEQQDWLADQIQTKCFSHIPLANRPRIVKGGPNDPLYLRDHTLLAPGVTLSYPFPNHGTAIIYANFDQWTSDAQLTVWDLGYDVVFDCARLLLNGGSETSPPYGFSPSALVRMVGKFISGDGPVLDQYYNDKSTRAESSVLDTPSIADMKLDWQVVLETPRYNNNVEAKYFGLAE